MIEVKLDTKDIEEHLRKLKYFFPNLRKQIIKDLVAKAYSYVKRFIKQALKGDGTGALLAALYKKSYETYAKTTFYKRQIGKANVAEVGSNVVAKKKKYLTYKVNGKWKKTKSMVRKPTRFFSKAEELFNALDKNSIMEKTASKLIKKDLGE